MRGPCDEEKVKYKRISDMRLYLQIRENARALAAGLFSGRGVRFRDVLLDAFAHDLQDMRSFGYKTIDRAGDADRQDPPVAAATCR